MVKHVMKNSWTEQEAKDIYQEAILVFWNKAISNNLVLTSKISTYIYAVTLNLWKKELFRKKRFTEEQTYESEGYEDNSFFETTNIEHNILMSCIENLSDNCMKILTSYYFDGMSMTNIAKMLGHSNQNTTKTMKYKCMKKLMVAVKKEYALNEIEYGN